MLISNFYGTFEQGLGLVWHHYHHTLGSIYFLWGAGAYLPRYFVINLNREPSPQKIYMYIRAREQLGQTVSTRVKCPGYSENNSDSEENAAGNKFSYRDYIEYWL